MSTCNGFSTEYSAETFREAEKQKTIANIRVMAAEGLRRYGGDCKDNIFRKMLDASGMRNTPGVHDKEADRQAERRQRIYDIEQLALEGANRVYDGKGGYVFLHILQAINKGWE